MRVRVFLSLVAAAFAAAVLVSASGAGALRVAKGGVIDVSTRTAVVGYLRSIHVDPRGLVIQRGVRNYAGSHCPGSGWSCTSTTHPVVQVAAAGGENTFSCSTPSCAVVQVAAKALATNTAKCLKTTGLGQSCTISQSSSSGDNVAIVYENATKSSGLTQTASSTASITQQTSGAFNNTACVRQDINIDGSTVGKKGSPVAVTLEAHQDVTIKQDALGTGANSAAQSATPGGMCTGTAVAQNQTLTSTATGSGAVTQNENAANNGANLTIDIEQNQGSAHGVGAGANTANFAQMNTLKAIANSPAGPVAQTQSSANGGLLGTINQDSTGVSTAVATQTETQCEDAAQTGLTTCDSADPDASEAPASLTQTQFGPVQKGVGTATQTGNGGDTFTVTQSSKQDNDTGSGQTNVVHGDCQTAGTCTVNQSTDINGTPSSNTQSGQDVNTSTNCTGSTCTTPQIHFDGSPGTNAPPSTLGPYEMTAFGTDSQPVCPNEGSIVSGVVDPAGTIGFSQALSHDLIGQCWATWSNGYTGDVYDTFNSGSAEPTQVTITLPAGTNAFYFYAEPQQFSVFSVEATAQDGTTSGPIDVQGEGGAQYFGFYGTGGATLSSITVTTADPTGFAVGEFGINTGS